MSWDSRQGRCPGSPPQPPGLFHCFSGRPVSFVHRARGDASTSARSEAMAWSPRSPLRPRCSSCISRPRGSPCRMRPLAFAAAAWCSPQRPGRLPRVSPSVRGYTGPSIPVCLHQVTCNMASSVRPRLSPRGAGGVAHTPSPGPSCPSLPSGHALGGALGRPPLSFGGQGGRWSGGLSSEPPATMVASAVRGLGIRPFRRPSRKDHEQ